MSDYVTNLFSLVKNVVVTGASRGIGEAIAISCKMLELMLCVFHALLNLILTN